MSDRVIDNPIINSPYERPSRHFAFDADGITDRIVEGRRPSSFFVPVPRPRKRGQQLELQVFTEDDISRTSRSTASEIASTRGATRAGPTSHR